MNASILVIFAQLSGASWGLVVDSLPFKTMAVCQAHVELISDQMVKLSKTNSTFEFRKEKTTDGGFFVRSDSRVAAILSCHQIIDS